ncbi:MAG TPA: CAP domain-containing protein [Acidimicrobiia bacterium]|nr:CAP domain-containing protein [Acidimicrobiia bacterium]
MKVSRLLASILIAVLLGAAGIVWGGGAEQEQVFSPPVTNAPTTTEPEYSAIVESAVAATPFEAEEEELTQSALSHATSTTTTTTTTVATTTTAEATTTDASATASRSSSPATTEAPSPPDPPATDAGFNSGAESDFAGRINSHRGGAGLGALSRSGSLDSYARSWAKKMASAGGLSHSNIGSLLGSWSAVAENVGMGGSVSGIFSALAGSGGHNANMLGDYTHMGIGAWVDDNGTIWTAHVFTR